MANLELRNQRRQTILELGVFKKSWLSNGYAFYFRKNLITTIDLYIDPSGNVSWSKAHFGGLMYSFLTLDQVLEQAPKQVQDSLIFNLNCFTNRG